MTFQNLKLRMYQFFRRSWPACFASKTESRKVVIVFVNYNTIELTSYLLFSIFRVLGTEDIASIVVVDNNSTDGSRELLELFADKGLIRLICNRKQCYHGPAVNQALRCLASDARNNPQNSNYRYIWLLDSDVIILRDDVVTDAVNYIETQNAAVIGQLQHEALPEGYAHVSSLLINPIQAWQRHIVPLDSSGAPGVQFQQSLRMHGLKVSDFPFRSSHYILHLSRGTLKSIFTGADTKNIYYEWAATHAEHHYHGDPDGPEIHRCFLNVFKQEVPVLTPETLLDACTKPTKVSIPLPAHIRVNRHPVS